jgi:hypothetical protein
MRSAKEAESAKGQSSGLVVWSKESPGMKRRRIALFGC